MNIESYLVRAPGKHPLAEGGYPVEIKVNKKDKALVNLHLPNRQYSSGAFKL